jgi:phosphomevalonate kinase
MNINLKNINKMFIGITGKMGSGKDFVLTNYILPILKSKNLSSLQVSFADQIKVNAMVKGNFSFENVYVNKTEESRKMLQIQGTEQGRNVFGEDIWIKYFDAWVKVHKSRGIQVFLNADTRFKNELYYIKENGGFLIKVVAPKRNEKRLLLESKGDPVVLNSIKDHPSECDLDDLSDSLFNLVIYNDPENDINSDEIINKLDLHFKSLIL